MSWRLRSTICHARNAMTLRQVHRRTLAPIAILAPGIACLLVSCGGEPRLALPETPPPASMTETQQSAPLAASPTSPRPAIGKIVWTTATVPESGAPASTVSHIPADADRIIAATQARALAAGTRVEATWIYNDTPLEAFTTTIPISQQIDEEWLSFHIERSGNVLWPLGRYELAISLNGVVVQEAAIEVSDPG